MRFNQLIALVGESCAVAVVEVVEDKPIIIYANPTLAALFEERRGDLLGVDFRTLFLDHHTIDSHNAFSTSYTSFSSLSLRTRSKVDLSIEIYTLFDEVGVPLFGIVARKRGECMLLPFEAHSLANDNLSSSRSSRLTRIPHSAFIPPPSQSQ